MTHTAPDRLVVLGMDGLSPSIIEQLMAAGQLPAFARLRERGGYRRLATSNPAQSPVAWSTIATGCNPGRHGVFDFLRRDPRTYTPELAILRVNRRNLTARREAMFLPVRQCPAFWSLTTAAGIPTSVIRWPLTLPPDVVSGRMLAGLGVPDLKANLGRYTLFTTRNVPPAQALGRKGDVVRLLPVRGVLQARLSGPERSSVPLQVRVDHQASCAVLRIDGEDCKIKANSWSDWVHVKFTVHFVRRVAGICRFHLRSLAPEVELYATPLQPDPRDPAFVLSHPESYASDLAQAVGDYHTLGMPEDTNALSDGSLDPDTFLEQCDMVMAERERMLWHELGRLGHGLLAFVFDTTDRVQHVFWRALDPSHPGGDAAFAARYARVVDDWYRRMDGILGGVLDAMGERSAVLVLSDHGFTAFRRAVHLNSWLIENGFMAVKTTDRRGTLFRDVDWSRTVAYAVGFSSIYLNLQGREGRGAVEPGDAPRVQRQIANKLAALRDAGCPAIERVYTRAELYHGPHAGDAPDLIVGFRPGYRTSWQTAIGGYPKGPIEDNRESWSGDHLVDPAHVPGVLFASRPLAAPEASVADVAPTILRLLRLSMPPELEGRPLLA